MRHLVDRWWPRLALLLLSVVTAQVTFALLDFEPRPVLLALLVTLVFAVLWLLLDALDAGETRWRERGERPGVPKAETSSYARLITDHLAADDPGPALRDRILALARARDPDLLDPDLRALRDAPRHRLTLTEIDHLLTRIEALRDHT